MFFVTRIKTRNPSILSKSFSLQNGELVSESGGRMIEGYGEKVELKSLEEFKNLLLKLSPSEALCYGVTNYKTVKIVSDKKLELLKSNSPSKISNTVSRTGRFFKWNSGPGIFMLDYDPVPGQPVLKREELLDKLYQAWPALRESPHLWRPSTSSCIYNELTNEELKGIRGQRVYVPVQNAEDIPRVGKVLFDTLWLNGEGHIVLSKSGSELLRSIIDTSVWQKERLDFCGGASCREPLAQRLEEPILINKDKPFIDTNKTLPPLSQELSVKVQEIKSQKSNQIKGKQSVLREKWIEERVRKCPEVKKELLLLAAQGCELKSDFILTTIEGTKITVEELLKNRSVWHGHKFLDPLEPDYYGGRPVGWINLNVPAPYLHSHAHGGARYALRGTEQTMTIYRDSLNAELLQNAKNKPSVILAGRQETSVEMGGR